MQNISINVDFSKLNINTSHDGDMICNYFAILIGKCAYLKGEGSTYF